MRFTIAAFSALVGLVLAQTSDFIPVTKPASDETVTAGTTYQVEWTVPAKYADGSVAISLIGGATQATLVPLGAIASGVKNSELKYQWAIDAGLGKDAIYGLVFTSEQDKTIFQFSNPFHIKAGAGGANTTVTSTTSAGTATVTLSSASTSAPATTKASNLTTTAGGSPRTTVTTLVSSGTGGSTTTGAARPNSTNGAVRATGGAIAGLAGLALAALAL